MAVVITQTADPAGVNSSSNVATYSGVSIGAASPNRIVVVNVTSELASASINSVTCGGVSMNAGTQGNQGIVYARTFYLLVPSGTTADIVVTFGANASSTQNHISVYTVTGGTYSSTGADQSTDMDATDPLTTGSTTIGTGGGMIAVAGCATDTVAKTWSNLTEDLDADKGSHRHTTATSTTAGTATRTCTGATNGEDGALSWLIFTENTSPTVALNSPADTANTGDLTPTLNFTGTDAQSDEVEYQVQVDISNSFPENTEIATDDFNRTNNSSTGMNLGSNWTSSAPENDLGIISNTAYQTADADDNAAFYSAATFDNDQYSKVTLTDATGASGVLVRGNATDYVLGQFNSPNYKIYWYNGGAYTEIATGAGSIANGDTLELRVIGTTYYLYKNGSLVISGTNGSAPSSGKPGIVIEDPGSRLDDWSGGNIGYTPLIDALSASDAGFTAGHPYPSGDATDYTVQSDLTSSTTYYWRARAIDPAGSNTYGAWATTRSFVATAGGGTFVKDLIGGGFIPFSR